MGLKGMVVFNSAMDEMQKSAKNLQAIAGARAKHEQAKAKLENDGKIAQAKLKNLELTGENTAIQNKLLEQQYKEYMSQQQTILDGQGAALDMEEHSNAQTGREAQKVAKFAYATDPDVKSLVAQHVNPRLQRVPGPQGGIVEGTPENENTPVAPNPNPLEPKYVNGKLNRFERKPYKSSTEKEKQPSYNDVLKLARDMAKDDTSQGPLANKIKKYLPEAKRIVYNQPEQTPGMTMDQVYKQDSPASKKTAAAGKKVVVEGPDGKQYHLPEEQLERAKKKGFKLVSQ